MQLLKNDTAVFSVSRRVDGIMISSYFETFAAAAGCASALNGTRLLNVKFSNQDGSSSWSGSLYVYGTDGTRRACNETLIKAVLKYEQR